MTKTLYARIGARFWSKVEIGRPDECWEWLASRRQNGYGQFWVGYGDIRYAHRVAWRLVHGTEPGPLCVLHHCDNPGCVNPSHLFLGTKLDNARDMVRKGRQDRTGLPGERNAQAKLTAAEVVAIRAARGTQQKDLAALYGVHQTTISRIQTGRDWKGVSG